MRKISKQIAATELGNSSSMIERFMRYCRINTRSDENSKTTPTTAGQLDFVRMLAQELAELGFEEINLNENNGFVIAKISANTTKDIPPLGFIAHVDTADYPADNIKPLLWAYEGDDLPLNAEADIKLTQTMFPFLAEYEGLHLVTSDGTTLLGTDDKAGIVEIIEALLRLQDSTEPHGDVYCAFGPDEEIGRGADNFIVADFPCRYAYTLDGATLGELQYESFNAAACKLKLQGVSVHPGSAKDLMINVSTVAQYFANLLPAAEVPERTAAYEGFYMLHSLHCEIDHGYMNYIIRDHDKAKFQARKDFFAAAVQLTNQHFNYPVIEMEMFDQYYNMYDIIKDHTECVDLALQAMAAAGVKPKVMPIRGGTDGSKISFMGLPTPNLFVGGTNLHGQYEFACVEHMEKAVATVMNIVQIWASKPH